MHELKSKGIKDESREEKHGDLRVEKRGDSRGSSLSGRRELYRAEFNTIVGTWNEGHRTLSYIGD